jgi:predicted peptidase
VHVPVWTFQSAGDTVVPIAGSLNMIKAIQAAGGHPCFTEFAGSAHDTSTWMAVYANSAMLAWMFAQGRPGATAPGIPQCAA